MLMLQTASLRSSVQRILDILESLESQESLESLESLGPKIKGMANFFSSSHVLSHTRQFGTCNWLLTFFITRRYSLTLLFGVLPATAHRFWMLL